MTDQTSHGGDAAEPTPAPGRRRAEGQRGFIARHKAAVILVALASVFLAGCSAWALYLNSQLNNIERVPIGLKEKQRPQHAVGKAADALNILLAGADNGPGPSIAQDVAHGRWQPGSHRSDTIMILHVTADRKHAYLVSIPRDSWVEIYNDRGKPTGKAKINSAFSLYGPSGYISTIEHLTNLRMDHLAIVDWSGFKDITRALGGVRVYIPQTFYDDSQRITWHKGWTTLEGKRALQYVRTRHGLTNGDFDRIKRQQNFLREMMSKLLSQGTLTNPVKLTSTLKAVTRNLTVDSDWTSGDIRSLAWSLRTLTTKDVTFLTAPLKKYATSPDGESIVKLKKKSCHALWAAMKHDDIRRYLHHYKADKLGSARTVH